MDMRRYYKPVQPSEGFADAAVSYAEWIPGDGVSSVIYCYWQLKSVRFLEAPFCYRVVADGCIDVFFDLTEPSESYVMGFCNKFVEFPLGNSFNYVGVRFFPTMFPQLFGVDASTLNNRFEKLSEVVPALADYIAGCFHASQRLIDLAMAFDGYFGSRLQEQAMLNDSRLYDALEIIFTRSGLLDVERDLCTGISARQLRRLFAYYVGDSAKTFSKVVRFQGILSAKPSSQSLRQNKLFYDAGYFDQSHFIKEFKALYGVTPSRAFGR